MLNINTRVNSLEEFKKFIENVEKANIMKTDKEFQKYIQNKCLETVARVANERVHGTTNDEYLSEYILRNDIRETSDGFIMYNNFTIPAILVTKNTKNQDRDLGKVRNYDNGFNLALAFEYGVGIVGQNNPINGSWDYNINNYDENGWYYKTPSGESIRTTGYQGAEVYRYTAIEIQKKLSDWVKSYDGKTGGASTL